MAGGKLGWKVFGKVTALVAGLAARKVLALVWSKASGRKPPANPAAPGTTWAEAASWAVTSGVVYGLARLVAERKAANTWVRATGKLPPGLEEVA